MFAPRKEVKSFMEAGAIYKNKEGKVIFITGILNGVVEFVEADDTENFSASALHHVDTPKKRVAALDMKYFLEKTGYTNK